MTLDAQVSHFAGTFDAAPTSTWPLAEALAAIRKGQWRAQVQYLRGLLASGRQARFDADKKYLPAFTFGGTFAPTRRKEHLVQHSGLAHFDFDHLMDPAHDRAVLTAFGSVVYVFISPSGRGLKAGVRVPLVSSNNDYKHAWQCVADFLQRGTGLAPDPSCKDVSRLCYVSCDPDIYVNLDADTFAVPERPTLPPASDPTPQQSTPPSGTRQQHYLRQAISHATKLITKSKPATATTPGNRHYNRRRAARLLGGYVAGGWIAGDVARDILEGIVKDHTDNLKKAMRTVDDGLRFGERSPVTYAQLEAERLAWCAARGYTPRREED